MPWCPFSVRHFHRTLGITTVYFLYTARPLDRDRSYEFCTPEICKRSQIDPESCQTQHTSDCTGCKPFNMPRASLLSSLHHNLFPVIRLQGDDENTKGAKSDILERETRGYIAISHVWADGTSNVDANSLPMCQLSRIQDQANQILVSDGPSTKPIPF